MKAVILAAGEGVRMRPLTIENPKPLLKIAGKTFIDYIFENLPAEVTEVVLVVKHLADKIKAHCGDNFHGRRIYYAEGSEKGNAYSFLAAKPFVRAGERVMVIYGDELILKNEVRRCMQHEFSWLCYHVPDPGKSGIAELDESGRILEVVEKPENPKSSLAAAGLLIAGADVFSYEPAQHANGEYYFSNLASQFCREHDVIAVVGDMQRPHLTVPDDIKKLEELLLSYKNI